jgi:hypothetical protein
MRCGQRWGRRTGGDEFDEQRPSLPRSSASDDLLQITSVDPRAAQKHRAPASTGRAKLTASPATTSRAAPTRSPAVLADDSACPARLASVRLMWGLG